MCSPSPANLPETRPSPQALRGPGPPGRFALAWRPGLAVWSSSQERLGRDSCDQLYSEGALAAGWRTAGEEWAGGPQVGQEEGLRLGEAHSQESSDGQLDSRVKPGHPVQVSGDAVGFRKNPGGHSHSWGPLLSLALHVKDLRSASRSPRLNGCEFEQTSGDSEGQGRLATVHGVAKSQTRLSNRTTTKNRSQDDGNGTLGGRSREHSGFLGGKDLESRLEQGDWRALGHSTPLFLGGEAPGHKLRMKASPVGCPLSYIPAKEHGAQCGSHGGLGSVRQVTQPDSVWSLPLTGQYRHVAGVMLAEKGHSLNPPIVYPDVQR